MNPQIIALQLLARRIVSEPEELTLIVQRSRQEARDAIETELTALIETDPDLSDDDIARVRAIFIKLHWGACPFELHKDLLFADTDFELLLGKHNAPYWVKNISVPRLNRLKDCTQYEGTH